MGGGGGFNCLFPIETHITCDFPGGGVGPLSPPPPPLDPLHFHTDIFISSEGFPLQCILAPLSDIPMFYIKYLTMHKVHDSAIRHLLYGCAYERGINHSLKLVDYLHVHTHKPCNDLHLLNYQ